MRSDVRRQIRRSGSGAPPARTRPRAREAGLISAEYAIGTLAAAAFAAVLLAVINAGGVGTMITNVIGSAFESLF